MSRSATRALDLLPLAGLAVLLLLALSWHDILPGGWRLRTLFEPDARRQAREDAANLDERLRAFAAEDPGVPPGSIVFLGSSIVQRFPLETAFPGRPCLDRGVPNLSARTMRAVLPRLLPTERPGAVVLYTGSIDWRAAGRDERVLVERVGAVLEELRRRLPDVPAALLGVLPERGTGPPEVEALRTANERLAAVAAEHGLAFVDVARPPIAAPDGSLSEACSTDRLHLNEEGYRHLARWILEDGGEVARRLAP